jgi:site-specific recombinase XerD
MSESHQPELYPGGTLTQDQQNQLSSEASIQAALGAFDRHMEEEEFAINTRKAFASDIRLLGKYLGVGQPIGEIGTKNLNDFLNWLLYERGVPCSRKSFARRVTTLKVFFDWLHQSGILPRDPASAVIQITVSSPLPHVPKEEDLAKALAASSILRAGTAEEAPDARPHLLLTLLLLTGIKKSETMTLVPNHIDRTDPEVPYVFIRYSNPSLRHKERKIPLDSNWLETLDEYLQQYQPGDTLFTCTARNLEYILSHVGEIAGLSQGLLSFENLRWASALRALRSGQELKQIRQNLGLSPVTWRETKAKLEKLQARQQGEI